MAVVLHVLAVIGIVLLWILLVLAVLIALILLVPFRYRGQVKKQGDAVDAKGTVWWLFHVFHLSGYFRRTEGKNDKGLEIYLFGIPVYSLLKKHKKNKLKKTPKTAKTSGKPGSHTSGYTKEKGAKKKPTIRPGERKSVPITVEVVRSKRPNLLVRLSAKVSAFFGRIKKAAAKAERTVDQINSWADYLAGASFARAKDVILKAVIALIRHILPRKIQGSVEFGFDDPSKTGMALGAIAMFYPVIPEKLEIKPDFEEKKLEADVTASGRIILAVVLVQVIRVILDKDVRILINRIKNTKKKTSKNKAAKGSTAKKDTKNKKNEGKGGRNHGRK
ncbi:MAG: DUF2953 domain-containing protein [Eubacterium sp.]|nr:DUF2953 domain-containing protein [Eubacterium sp.]